MNLAGLDYVGSYSILYYATKVAALILGFGILNFIILSKSNFRKTKKFKIINIVALATTVACILVSLFAYNERKENIYKLTIAIQENVSTDYSILTSADAYEEIIELYDNIALGKDYYTDNFIIYNKVTNKEETVELMYKEGILRIRGIL